MTSDDFVVIGLISKPQGIRGGLRLWLNSIPEEVLSGLEKVYVTLPDGRDEPFWLERSRSHKNFIVVNFRGIDNRNQAEDLRDCIVKIPRKLLPPLMPNGEYFDFDLVGLSVYTDSGELIGELTEVLDLPAHNVYVIQSEKYNKVLIPAIEQIILEVDLDKNRMIIYPMEGLFK